MFFLKQLIGNVATWLGVQYGSSRVVFLAYPGSPGACALEILLKKDIWKAQNFQNLKKTP